MTFFVFQGSMYEEECRGGYIWAPIANKDGLSFHHWDRLMDIRQGDIIFHGCDGFVQAIFYLRSDGFSCYTLLNTYRRKEGVQRCKSMLSDRVRPLWKHFVPI